MVLGLSAILRVPSGQYQYNRGNAQLSEELESKLGLNITCSQEAKLLGIDGLLALARDKLFDGSRESFFVLNSDDNREYPFVELIKFHKSHSGEDTIMVTKVDKPSNYGVMVMNEEIGEVNRFIEKPKTFIGNKINIGIYLLNLSVLERIEPRLTSIEKEVFPRIIADQKLFTMVLPGFWMDIRKPQDYITGLRLYLDSSRARSSLELAIGPNIVGNVLVHESALIGDGCLIKLDVSIGSGYVIGPRVWLEVHHDVRGSYQDARTNRKQHHQVALHLGAVGVSREHDHPQS